MVFKKAKDRNGEFAVDWSMFTQGHGDPLPAQIEFIPYSKGDARVCSIPAEEMMYCGLGEGKLTHAVIAMRIDQWSVHYSLSPALLRQLAGQLLRTADLIDAGVPA